MVRLEGILHHSDEPPAFLQVPCHSQVSTRATDQSHGGRARGQGGPNRHPRVSRTRRWVSGTPWQGQRPRGESEPGSDGGVSRRKGNDYRIKAPITLNIRTSASPMNATAEQSFRAPPPQPPPPRARRRSVPLSARPSVRAAATSSAAALQRIHAG